MNIRKEIEAQAEEWEERFSDLSEHSMEGSTFRSCAAELRRIIKRIPEGWEMRPRNPSKAMRDAAWRKRAVTCWVAMWDAAKKEAGDE